MTTITQLNNQVRIRVEPPTPDMKFNVFIEQCIDEEWVTYTI